MLETKLKRLTALRGEAKDAPERYRKLADALLAENPRHLPLLLELLAYAQTAKYQAADAPAAAHHPKGGGHQSEGSSARESAGQRASRAAMQAGRVVHMDRQIPRGQGVGAETERHLV